MPEAVITVVRAPDDGCQHPKHVDMYSRLQKCNKLNKSHLAGQLLNSIHDARTHVYKYIYIYIHTRSVRKVSDRILLCEHLMDYNLARLLEPTLNLSAHA